MGQKVNPIGFRLAVNRDWRSQWYASPQGIADYFLAAISRFATYVKKKLRLAAVSKIVIERAWNSIRVTIHTARPGIVIGRKGAEIEKMTEEISKMAGGKQVKIDIRKSRRRRLDAQLVAENVALQIERRICLPPRDEEGGAAGDGFRRAGHPAPLLRPPGWRGNRARGVVSRGQNSAAHAAHADRLRIRRSEHRLRQDRREVLDL